VVVSSRRLERGELEAGTARLRGELRRHRRELRHVRVGNEILREAAGPLIHRAPARERFAFIHARCVRFGVRRVCRVLITGHGNYHAWVRAWVRRDGHTIDDRGLTEWIVEIHTARPACGAERVIRELTCQGLEVGRRRVARLMREHGVAGITRRKRRNLTKPDCGAAAVPDLVGDFAHGRLDR
jgi:putative transposase